MLRDERPDHESRCAERFVRATNDVHARGVYGVRSKIEGEDGYEGCWVWDMFRGKDLECVYFVY